MKNRKLLWLDSETTGTDPEKHSLIQIAAIVDDGKKIIDEFDCYIRPFKGSRVSASALEKNNTTIDELRHSPKYIDSCTAMELFEDWMSRHVNRFDKTDKFIIAGKNVKFDVNFLRKWFDRCENNFFGSWFFYPVLDLENELAEMLFNDPEIVLNDYKLSTIADLLDVELNAHEAMSDIKATRECWRILKGLN